MPEVRTTFHARHNLNRLELTSRAMDFNQLRELKGFFYLTATGADSMGRQLRNRRAYPAKQIQKGRFFSLEGRDKIPEDWLVDPNKPPVNWDNFYKFELESEMKTAHRA